MAFARPYSLSYHPGNVCRSLKANVVPNGLFIKIKTITEWYRVFRFLDTHPNPKLVLGDDMLSGCGHVDNIAVW